MKESQKEKVEEAAATGVGAGIGGVGGATVGLLELAANQGTATVTGISAGLVIGAGAVAGGLAFFLGYKAYRHFRKPKT